MPIEQNGANGEMVLKYFCEESASSHRDQWRRTKLYGKDTIVELEIESGDHIASKGTCDMNGSRYSIPVEELIELIKEHGKKLTWRRRPPKLD